MFGILLLFLTFCVWCLTLIQYLKNIQGDEKTKSGDPVWWNSAIVFVITSIIFVVVATYIGR
jgi:hypothetical protein